MKNLPIDSSNSYLDQATEKKKKHLAQNDLNLHSRGNYIPSLPYEVLLDYVNGVLSEIERQVVEEYLIQNPEDEQIIEGIRLFQKQEGMSDPEMESFLNLGASDTEFLENHLVEVKKASFFKKNFL